MSQQQGYEEQVAVTPAVIEGLSGEGAIEGLSGEGAIEGLSGDEQVMTRSLVPRATTHDGGARLFGWIFGVSLLAHAPAAFGLATNYRPAHEKRVQEVEIQLAPPPPEPPPEPPPPPPPDPEPPKPVPQQVPRVHLQAAPISVAPTAPLGDVPNVVATPGELAMPAPVAAAVPTAPSVAPAPPPPPPIVEAKEGAHYRNNARPAYPRLALREGWEGTVLLRVRVSPDGHVAQATVQQSAGHSVLDEAALAIVKDWLFDPATQGGRGVLSIVTVPLQFKIQ